MPDHLGEIHLRNLLLSATVSELTRETQFRLSPTDTIATAISFLRDRNHGCALICDSRGLLGIVTERDILQALNTDIDLAKPLTTIMSSEPTTVSANASLFQAISLMVSGGYRHLPVLDADGTPAGVVDVKTLTGFLVEHFPEAIYNCASLADITTRHREGA
ncbi:MAG: CBS domain-containing protein [Planctomycetaceae bacterium]